MKLALKNTTEIGSPTFQMVQQMKKLNIYMTTGQASMKRYNEPHNIHDQFIIRSQKQSGPICYKLVIDALVVTINLFSDLPSLVSKYGRTSSKRTPLGPSIAVRLQEDEKTP